MKKKHLTEGQRYGNFGKKSNYCQNYSKVLLRIERICSDESEK